MSALNPLAPLKEGVVYLSPLNRRCRWVPPQGEQRQITSYATFIYLDVGVKNRHVEAAGWMEGFHLTPPNFRLLREVQP